MNKTLIISEKEIRTQANPSSSVAGFGLLEALVSMFVLALMFTAVCMMNYSNHNAALRIATRNEAVSFGNRLLDSLQTLGVSQVDTSLKTVTYIGDTNKTVGAGFTRQYLVSFKGTRLLDTEGIPGYQTVHVRAAQVNIGVTWILRNHKDSISISGVVQ